MMALVSPRLLPQLSALRFTIASIYIYPYIPSSVTTTIRYHSSRPSVCRVAEPKIIAHLHQPSLCTNHPPKQPVHVLATTRDPRDPPIDSTAQHPPCQHQTRPHFRLHHLSISPRALHFPAVRPRKNAKKRTTTATTPTAITTAKTKKLPLHRRITRSRKNPHPSQMR